MRHECLVRPEDLGPFLLGQLPPEELARVAEAVATCPSCAAEARQLRPVVTSLSMAAAEAPPEPGGLAQIRGHGRSGEFDRLLASVRRERTRRRARTRRRRALVAAAAAVLLVAVVSVIGLTRANTGPGAQVALVGSGSAQGSAVVQQRDWGTAIVLSVHGLKPGRYGAWLQDRSGQRAPAGTFTLGSGGVSHLELSVLMSLDDAASLGVTQLGGHDVLLHKF